jgi:hypothetical protein
MHDFSHATARRGPRFVMMAALLALAVAHANADVPAPSPAALEDLDARAAVEVANAWKGNGVTSYADAEEVVFAFPDGAEVRIPMPADAFFVSVAPYVDHTHPCTTHYMSGCQGELVDVAFRVRATLPDGTVVLDDTVRTGANGFLDLWLPRDQAILLSVSASGYAADAILATAADSPTCITTVRLARAAN